MIKLAPHDSCTGCGACYSVCPFNAISMKKDKKGFFYPKINKELCKKCKKCVRKCPVLTPPVLNEPICCFAGKGTDSSLVEGCSSGGIATALMNSVLNKKGVVYGALYERGKGVHHVRSAGPEVDTRYKGSKYVQSDITDAVKQINNDIKRRTVLFIGTPCQVAAVNSMYNSENLYTVSFVCGGVPSENNLGDYLKSQGIDYYNIDKIEFRDKSEYLVRIISQEKVIFQEDRESSDYLYAFDRSMSLRESCINCPYCKEARVGDITIGDFWGIEKYQYLMSKEKCVSCVMVTSKKGEKLLQSADNIKLEAVAFEDIIKNNIRLTTSKRNRHYSILRFGYNLLYPFLGYEKTVKFFRNAPFKKMRKIMR